MLDGRRSILGSHIDFGEVKRLVGKWIDDTLDHTMLLHRDDPLIPELRKAVGFTSSST